MEAKKYDLVSIGTGSAMSIVTQVLRSRPELDVAVIENERPGGICLTRGCIPSKMLLYPAEVIQQIKKADEFGIDVDIKNIDFEKIMQRMRDHVRPQSKEIEKNLKDSDDMDFYHGTAEFVDDYTLKVGNQILKGKKIIIGSGSRNFKPPIENLEEVGYLTSKTILDIKELPESVTVIGGGYIGAEYGYFLSMMGADVTIVGRNSRMVASQEPQISEVLEKKLSKYLDIHTGYEAVKVAEKEGKKGVLAKKVDPNSEGKEKLTLKSDEILLAAGRRSNSDLLKPERTGVETDEDGWIKVDKKLETTKKNIWALGDATGNHMFKHVANYEAEVVFKNAFGDEVREVDYHAVPHAVFTYPQVASVGLTEEEAKKEHDILIGHYPYENTAKGSAMELEDYFVKVIVEQETFRILGAHIIGPQASVLIQEVVNLMYTAQQDVFPVYRGMHIHPSLSEVVERAMTNLHSHDHDHKEHDHSHTG